MKGKLAVNSQKNKSKAWELGRCSLEGKVSFPAYPIAREVFKREKAAVFAEMRGQCS